MRVLVVCLCVVVLSVAGSCIRLTWLFNMENTFMGFGIAQQQQQHHQQQLQQKSSNGLNLKCNLSSDSLSLLARLLFLPACLLVCLPVLYSSAIFLLLLLFPPSKLAQCSCHSVLILYLSFFICHIIILFHIVFFPGSNKIVLSSHIRYMILTNTFHFL